MEYVPVYHHTPMVPVWLDGALKKALRIAPSTRYPGMSEWLYDLWHPNEKYLETGHLPLIERDPVRFWKMISLLLAGLVVLLVLTR